MPSVPRRAREGKNSRRMSHQPMTEGDHHRVSIFEVALDEPQRVWLGLSFEHRQIFAFTRDDIEGASMCHNVIKRHRLDPGGPRIQR